MKMIDYNLLKGKITAMQSTEQEYAFNFLNNAQNPSTEWECIEDMLDSMEVYEAEPVKRGRWSECYTDSRVYSGICTVCSKASIRSIKENPLEYCPKCGARMKEE